MNNTEQSGLVKLLQAELDKAYREEVIGGTSIADVLDYVMLDVAHTPVLPTRNDQYDFDIPQPIDAMPTMGGQSYILNYGDGHAETVHEGALKVMRARFLLTKNHFYQRMLKGGFGDRDQQKVIAWYFGGSVWIPNDGPLKEAMLR